MKESESEMNNLVHYELNTSNYPNYITFHTSSSPESFPELMKNGVLVQYKEIEYTTELIESKIHQE